MKVVTKGEHSYLEVTEYEKQQYIDYMKSRGIVYLSDGTFEREENLHGSERKIDYVCRILGDASVTAMLKEAFGGSIFNVDPKRYRQFMEDVLIPMAESDEKFNM